MRVNWVLLAGGLVIQTATAAVIRRQGSSSASGVDTGIAGPSSDSDVAGASSTSVVPVTLPSITDSAPIIVSTSTPIIVVSTTSSTPSESSPASIDTLPTPTASGPTPVGPATATLSPVTTSVPSVPTDTTTDTADTSGIGSTPVPAPTLGPTGAQVVASLSPSLSLLTSGGSTVTKVVSVTAGSATVTVVPALSQSTSAGQVVTVTAADITVASGGAVITTQSAAFGFASASATASAAPPQNSTIPASAPNVTYSSGSWTAGSDTSPSTGGGGGGGSGQASDQQSTPLGPSLNNANVPPGLQCPSTVTAEETKSSYDVGATVSYEFSGTGIFFQLVPRNTTGIYTAWVDTPSNAISIDGFQQFSQQQEMSPQPGAGAPSCQIGFGVEGLPDGMHTIWIRLDGPSPLVAQQEQAPGLTVAGFTQTAPKTLATSGAVTGKALPGRFGLALSALVLLASAIAV